jgi:hypothetical protein
MRFGLDRTMDSDSYMLWDSTQYLANPSTGGRRTLLSPVDTTGSQEEDTSSSNGSDATIASTNSTYVERAILNQVDATGSQEEDTAGSNVRNATLAPTISTHSERATDDVIPVSVEETNKAVLQANELITEEVPVDVSDVIAASADTSMVGNDDTQRSPPLFAEMKVEETSIEPFIDMISIGTILKPEHQSAQELTFGSHASVRNFFRISELNDTDAACYKNLTVAQQETIIEFCKNGNDQSYESATLRKWLKPYQSHRHSAGWICAQKRPIDGLRLVLERYKHEPLPSYLIIVDDDSYINMDPLVGTLRNAHSPDFSIWRIWIHTNSKSN